MQLNKVLQKENDRLRKDRDELRNDSLTDFVHIWELVQENIRLWELVEGLSCIVKGRHSDKNVHRLGKALFTEEELKELMEYY